MTKKEMTVGKTTKKDCVVIITQYDGQIIHARMSKKEIMDNINWWLSTYQHVEIISI